MFGCFGLSVYRLPADEGFAEPAARAFVREGGAALDEAGVPGRRQFETASIRFLLRKDQSRGGKFRQPRRHSCCSE